tara:strand:- start:939 stop:1049 length:111 start_codon:yes stop_codon:yes gene_type:complete
MRSHDGSGLTAHPAAFLTLVAIGCAARRPVESRAPG